MELVRVNGVGGLITVKQAAEMLGITISGVHKLIRRQNLPVVKLGNSLLLKASDLRLTRE